MLRSFSRLVAFLSAALLVRRRLTLATAQTYDYDYNDANAVESFCAIALDGVCGTMTDIEIEALSEAWRRISDFTWARTPYNLRLDSVTLESDQKFVEYSDDDLLGRRRKRLLRNLRRRRGRNRAGARVTGRCNGCPNGNVPPSSGDGANAPRRDRGRELTDAARDSPNFQTWTFVVSRLGRELRESGHGAFEGLEALEMSCDGQPSIEVDLPKPCCSDERGTRCAMAVEHCDASPDACAECEGKWLPFGPIVHDECAPRYGACNTNGFACCDEEAVSDVAADSMFCVPRSKEWSQCLLRDDLLDIFGDLSEISDPQATESVLGDFHDVVVGVDDSPAKTTEPPERTSASSATGPESTVAAVTSDSPTASSKIPDATATTTVPQSTIAKATTVSPVTTSKPPERTTTTRPPVRTNTETALAKLWQGTAQTTGEGFCSEDLKTRKDGEWCNYSKQRCENSCSLVWVPGKPSDEEEGCVPRRGDQCIDKKCCGRDTVGATCVIHSEYWSECLAPRDIKDYS